RNLGGGGRDDARARRGRCRARELREHRAPDPSAPTGRSADARELPAGAVERAANGADTWDRRRPVRAAAEASTSAHSGAVGRVRTLGRGARGSSRDEGRFRAEHPREERVMTQIDPFAQLKMAQREGWSLFAPMETGTTMPAFELVRFARIAPGER